MSYGQIAPHPAALIESLGALGYSLGAAVSDLIDNSISVGSSSIEVNFDWNEGTPFATILDNGHGMSTEELVEAMRLGGAGPSVVRQPNDLGRYGLGLKTASFSQCGRLTVATKQSGEVSCARWDTELMANSHSGWELLSEPANGSEPRLLALQNQLGSGTIVLWELLRTGMEGTLSRFLEALESLERHVAMVFQGFIDGDVRKVVIKLNGRVVKPWDPFVRWHPATLPKPQARLNSGPSAIRIQGYILPHRDRFETVDAHEIAGGPEGWVGQQGFYIYRAGRLIVAGGWLGLGGSREWLRDEASQLARIRIEIPNTADADWRIDVRKSTARPPASLRDALMRIALDVRLAARGVYAHRGSRGTVGASTTQGGIWTSTKSRRYPYAIKRDHPTVQSILDISSEPELVEAMLVAIEHSVPVPSAFMQEVAEESEVTDLVIAARVLMKNLVELGLDQSSAAQRVAGTEPFSQIPGIASILQNKY